MYCLLTSPVILHPGIDMCDRIRACTIKELHVQQRPCEFPSALAPCGLQAHRPLSHARPEVNKTRWGRRVAPAPPPQGPLHTLPSTHRNASGRMFPHTGPGWQQGAGALRSTAHACLAPQGAREHSRLMRAAHKPSPGLLTQGTMLQSCVCRMWQPVCMQGCGGWDDVCCAHLAPCACTARCYAIALELKAGQKRLDTGCNVTHCLPFDRACHPGPWPDVRGCCGGFDTQVMCCLCV